MLGARQSLPQTSYMLQSFAAVPSMGLAADGLTTEEHSVAHETLHVQRDTDTTQLRLRSRSGQRARFVELLMLAVLL
jgi:hypothetical protein